MGWDFNVGFQPYGTPYTKARKLFHHGFNAHASEQYVPIQTVINFCLQKTSLTSAARDSTVSRKDATNSRQVR